MDPPECCCCCCVPAATGVCSAHAVDVRQRPVAGDEVEEAIVEALVAAREAGGDDEVGDEAAAEGALEAYKVVADVGTEKSVVESCEAQPQPRRRR